ncbi:MAG: hypothetical protein ACREMP_08860 [Candidatus Tyrphobacter sp.]
MPPGFSPPAVASRVLAHYARYAALLDASFAGAPIVFADFPRGFHSPPRFRATQIPLSGTRIGWLVQREYAVEFHGWAALASDPERLRFGRVLLEAPDGESRFPAVRDAALLMREELREVGYDAIAVLDGAGSITLWLPFAQAPPASKIRVRLQRLCVKVAVAHPEYLYSGVLRSDKRVRLDATANAPGRYGILPYSLRGTPALPVCTPVEWEELATLRSAVLCTAETWPTRFEEKGDLFARAAAALQSQRLRTRAATVAEGVL